MLFAMPQVFCTQRLDQKLNLLKKKITQGRQDARTQRYDTRRLLCLCAFALNRVFSGEPKFDTGSKIGYNVHNDNEQEE